MVQLLSNLPVGSKVKFGKYSVNGEPAQALIWLVVAQNHSTTPAYPENTATLLTEKIIDARCFDAKEPNNIDAARKQYGNNLYSTSNIDQWLNKDNAAGEWFVAQHSSDTPPDEVGTTANTPYVSRPGFLNAFTDAEKNAIQTSTIKVVKADGQGADYENISRKVFLPSSTEVGLAAENGYSEGEMWAYFSVATRIAYFSTQAFNNTTSIRKSTEITEAWHWWLRTPNHEYPAIVHTVNDVGTLSGAEALTGMYGVRPALNISSSVLVTDTVDADGCYVVTFNTAPSTPSIFNIPTIYGGKSNAISWSNSTDLQGDVITYQLECSYDGNDWEQIYSGISTVYAHEVPFGTTTVAYRVKAADPLGTDSAYITSDTRTVINNNAPEMPGMEDTNLGVCSSGFTMPYIVEDADGDTVTVTESIDGVRIRSFVATLGQRNFCEITDNHWLVLPNGSHTLTISATDGIDTTTKTFVFTKLVDSFSIQNSTPWGSGTRASRIILVITRNIPSTSRFKVEVCNNGYDSNPTWEDATDAVVSGLAHVFTNERKTATNWGVLVRVTVERNGAAGACYVSAIGGNFE